VAEPPEIFRDAQGQPAFVQCAVLFLDLLGTAGERDPKRMLDRLRRTKRAVERARDLSPRASDKGLWRMTWFSDNLGLHRAISDPVVAGSQAVGSLVTDVGWLQLAFLEEGLVARGAIAIGEFYADAEFIHGPALERAVELEKQHAKVPRVLLDGEAVGIARDSLIGEYGGGMTAPWRVQLLVDQAGEVFVDYLSTMTDYDTDDPYVWRADLQRHGRLIVESLERFNNDDRVRPKYEWLAAYHNDFVARYASFLGPLAAQLRVEGAPSDVSFLPFGHDVAEAPEASIGGF
jgi:hypothetical protein